jgi:hypothetical protein
MGASPQTPGILRLLDQSMEPHRSRGRTERTAPHTSVTYSALRLLPSIALSSEQVRRHYQKVGDIARCILLLNNF